MGKGVYIGVGGKARKVKKMYVGVNTEFPIYSESTTLIRYGNISQYFSVQDDDYAFKFDVGTKSHIATSTNKGIASSTAKTTLTAKQDMDINFDYSYSSEPNYDKFTLIVAGTTVENAVSGATTTKSYSGSLKTGQSIVFQYAKDGSQNENDDQCTFSNMNVTVRIQTGTETKDVARKVKKAYIGVGGVARPCFGGGELAYYGTATPLYVEREGLAAASIGDYALFGGGYRSLRDDTPLNKVDTYSSVLTHGTSITLSKSNREYLAATSLGNYALFGGGRDTPFYSDWVLDAFNSSLALTTKSIRNAAIHRLAATTIGNYALFGGGTVNFLDEEWADGTWTTMRTDIVYAYNSSLSQSTPTKLSVARYNLAATTIGNYALFGGGDGAAYYNTIDVYNTSLVRTTPTVLSDGRSSLAATTIGEYALFGGGYGTNPMPLSGEKDIVDAYNKSLVHSTPTVLSVAKSRLAAVTLGEYALFGGGIDIDNHYSGTVDVYDKSLTRSITTNLSEPRSLLAATSLGNYALFGGGNISNSEESTTVDVYTIV